MEKDFWHNKWKNEDIGFHSSRPSPALDKFAKDLVKENKRHAFLPLCGKSLDLIWFSERVDQVTGVELSEKAILDFFQENNLKYTRRKENSFEIFQSGNISLYCGDFFNLALKEMNIDIIFDRAALVALPPEMRIEYYNKFKNELKESASWLLCVFDYVQEQMDGPPFAISEDEIISNLGEVFKSKVLEKRASSRFEVDRLQEAVYLIKSTNEYK